MEDAVQLDLLDRRFLLRTLRLSCRGERREQSTEGDSREQGALGTLRALCRNAFLPHPHLAGRSSLKPL